MSCTNTYIKPSAKDIHSINEAQIATLKWFWPMQTDAADVIGFFGQ